MVCVLTALQMHKMGFAQQENLSGRSITDT